MGKCSDGEGTAPRRRKDGIWYRAIRIEGTGKRKYLYAKTKAELDKKYKEFAKHIATGTYTEIRKQTVEEYMLKPADHLQANRTETQILRYAGKPLLKKECSIILSKKAKKAIDILMSASG